MFVLIVYCICFLVQQVDIIIQTGILLFCLDKCSDYFLYVLNASCILNLVKCILNNFSIAHVLIKQLLFLFVGLHDLVQTQFQNSNWIRKLCLLTTWTTLRVIYSLIETLVIKLNGLISFLQSFLQLLYLQFKSLLLFLMLCL